ncbi:FO synthase subunit 1, partial [Durusdinium trenchii]
MVSFDACVWPSNSALVTQGLQTAISLLSMSQRNGMHLQMPLSQAQTKIEPVLKHRRLLEDTLVAGGMDISCYVTLSFDKTQRHAGDKRKGSHPCLFVSASSENNEWSESAAAQTGSIGPVPLIRMNEMIGYDPDLKWGPALRIGIKVHTEIVNQYLKGMDFNDEDVVVWADIMPNRHAEFARAILGRQLEGNSRRPPIHYVGCLREPDQADVATALEAMVYEHWNNSPTSPPKSRPSEPVPEPSLSILAWSDQSPLFPESLLQKFGPGNPAHQEILAMQASLTAEFPNATVARKQSQGSNTVSVRGARGASGRPDYTVDGGAKPLNFERTIEMTDHIPVDSFTVERKAYAPGGRGKPAVIVGEDFSFWLGNETSEELSLVACEICGFNVGQFEERFASDLALVSHEKKLMSIAEYARVCSTVHGAGDDGEALPVPYRFNLSPAANGKCNVFKPNPLPADSGRQLA